MTDDRRRRAIEKRLRTTKTTPTEPINMNASRRGIVKPRQKKTAPKRAHAEEKKHIMG